MPGSVAISAPGPAVRGGPEKDFYVPSPVATRQAGKALRFSSPHLPAG